MPRGPLNGWGRELKAIFASALLGGWRNTDGSFNNLGDNGNYWSATENSSGNAWNYNFNRNNGKLNRNNNNKGFGFSCRCVQDSKPGGGKWPPGHYYMK